MRNTKDRVRIDISNYDPSDRNAQAVSYHFKADDMNKIMELLKANIDAGMYILIHPWWTEEKEGA